MKIKNIIMEINNIKEDQGGCPKIKMCKRRN